MKQAVEERILSSFRRQVQHDKNIRNAYLLVHFEKHEIDLKIAEGTTDESKADIHQPIYLASVGKIDQ